MKALTIWQPWASLIVAGAKPYEFREWPAPRFVQGQRIAIHAGARPIRVAEVADLLNRLDDPEQAWTTALRPEIARPLLERVWRDRRCLPLSSVVGTAVLGTPVRSWTILGEFGVQVNDSDREDCNWAWPLTDIRPLEPIAPAKGAQGFWDWGGSDA